MLSVHIIQILLLKGVGKAEKTQLSDRHGAAFAASIVAGHFASLY